MHAIRARYAAISLRGRLFALLLSVGLMQGVVAAFTFQNLESKPIDQRIRAQLSANVRAVAPVIDGELRSSAQGLQRLSAQPKLVTAIENRDRAGIEQIINQTLGGGQ